MSIPGGYLWYQATRDGGNGLSGIESEAAENIGSNKNIAETEPYNLHNNPERLKGLIESGANVNDVDENGRTVLSKAAGAGNIECVQLLLAAEGIDVNKSDNEGDIPLHHAARKGHSSCVKLLLETPGIDVNKTNKDGITPLLSAVFHGQSECVKLLLEAPGIDISDCAPIFNTLLRNSIAELQQGLQQNKENNHDISLLNLACRDNVAECVSLILNARKADTAPADKTGTPPLSTKDIRENDVNEQPIQSAQTQPNHHEAPPDNEPEISGQSAKDNARNALREQGITEDMYEYAIISYWRDIKKLQLLIEVGANVNATDERGLTVLSKAVASGHLQHVKLLLNAQDIDVNKADKAGRTPLFYAVQCGQIKCIKLLLGSPGIDVNKAAKFEGTPLIVAAGTGRKECVQILLATRDIDVNKTNHLGETALIWAAHHGHSECVKLLLEAPGIDINLADKQYGKTPLIWAAADGQIECVKLLLEAPGIDITLADKIYSKTPLNWVAAEGQIECVKLLLETPGIDINLADKKYGKTPLIWAATQMRTQTESATFVRKIFAPTTAGRMPPAPCPRPASTAE